MINDRLKVNVNTTDFKHIIKEVKLTRTLQYSEKEKKKTEKLKKKMN